MTDTISADVKKKPNRKNFPIVAVGASAGGIQAVNELLGNLSPNTGMAFIYIIHLDPEHESNIAAVLGRNTEMKVTEASHLVTIEPNNVYVIPANKEMTIVEGVLALSPRPEKRSMHNPIDLFFSSLAEKHREGTIGILLSGCGSDGAMGLKTIKLAGGFTFAQNETAQFQSMPKSAISEGIVDMVLSPAQIAQELERLSRKISVLLDVAEDSGNETDKDEALTEILHLVKKTIGVDFSHYKTTTIRRRILRRMVLAQLDDKPEYLTFLKKNTQEVSLLYQDLLINVTSFFRDPDALEYLKKAILPRIIKARAPSDPIRVWVPACSTGEEAYTLAMLFLEELGDKAGSIPLQIFATDLSELVISKARLGIYCTNDVANVSDQRLEKFFTKIDGSYRINKVVRDLCVFAPHNVSKDPPFSRMDLISCCNLMIYLDTVLQKKILNIFHYALNPEGYLVLGKSETIGNAVQLFSQLEKKYKIYTRKGEGSNNAGFEMTYRIPEQENINIENRKKVKIKENDHHADLEKAVDNLLLNKYIPATVVINHELEILQFRGSTGLYLEPSPGRASLNLIKMAKPALAFELRNAVHKANKEGQPVKRNGIEMMINEKNHLVQIEVVPLKSDTEDRLFLVIFEKVLLPSRQLNSADSSKDALVLELEKELGALKEDIHSIIEEQEASNEELQSANEEIVSSNEELQSINEELETSKEELESTNEELMTINAELQMRNEQLSEAYEYAEMVFNTISEGVLILDKDLRMRSANNRFFQIFDLKEENIEGQLFFEFENRQWDLPTMREMLDQTIPKLGQCRRVQLTHTFKGVGEKTFLINCSRLFQKVHREQITLIAFEDITQYTKKSG